MKFQETPFSIPASLRLQSVLRRSSPFDEHVHQPIASLKEHVSAHCLACLLREYLTVGSYVAQQGRTKEEIEQEVEKDAKDI